MVIVVDEGGVRLPEVRLGLQPAAPVTSPWLPAGRRRGVTAARHPALAVLLVGGVRGGLGGVDEVQQAVAGSPILRCKGALSSEGTESAP